MILLPGLLGCGPGVENREGITLECTNMVQSFNGTWRTPGLTVSALSDAVYPRCWFYPSATLTGSDAAVIGGEAILDLGVTTDQMYLAVSAFGTQYLSYSGSVSFDEWDPANGGRASGSYDLVAQPSGQTDLVDISGSFDWCAVGQRSDCPRLPEDTLPDAFTMVTPAYGEVEGKSSACRMLVDPTTRALQVDFQVALWEGRNVGDLWVEQCTQGVGPVMDNRLVFRAGGVDGPGDYGPVQARSLPSSLLPYLSFSHPTTFNLGLSVAAACMNYYVTAEVRGQESTSCSWTVDPGDGERGRFLLDCARIRHQSLPGPQSFDLQGDFHLEADCVYLEQPS